MLGRFFLFLVGFGFLVLGFSYMILFLNLLTIGYNFSEYVNFIVRSYQTYFILIGFILMSLSVYIGGKKHELYL